MRDQDHESTRRSLVAMLHRCADYLSTLPAEEVDAFLDGEMELRMSIVAKKGKRKKKQTAKLDAGQLTDIVAQLRSLDDRSEGERLIREIAPTKAAVEGLARHLDVAIRREDRLEDLIRRIIETTIGFRLSSAAIQGKTSGRAAGEATIVKSPQSKK